MISKKDRAEILEQYNMGYAYPIEHIMRVYDISEAEAQKVMKDGELIKGLNLRYADEIEFRVKFAAMEAINANRGQ